MHFAPKLFEYIRKFRKHPLIKPYRMDQKIATNHWARCLDSKRGTTLLSTDDYDVLVKDTDYAEMAIKNHAIQIATEKEKEGLFGVKDKFKKRKHKSRRNWGRESPQTKRMMTKAKEKQDKLNESQEPLVKQTEGI